MDWLGYNEIYQIQGNRSKQERRRGAGNLPGNINDDVGVAGLKVTDGKSEMV